MENDFDADTYEGSMNRVEYWQYHVNGWLSKPDVFFVSFEKLKEDYKDTILEIADYLEEPRPREPVSVFRKQPAYGLLPGSRLVEKAQHLFKRKVKNIKYTSVYYSGGKKGGYMDLFSEADIRYFEDIAGSLLRKLGYTQN
jgi:hypothetical protein